MKGRSRPLRRTPKPQKRRRLTAPGASPGTLVAPANAAPPKIRCIGYGPAGVTERDAISANDLPSLTDGQTVRWIDVINLGDAEAIQKIGDVFGLHPLALEDILDPHQRPKVDVYEDHLLVITQALGAGSREAGATDGRLETHQVAICLGHDFVVTFRETPGNTFDPVLQRLHAVDGRFRRRGPDYLAYALIDAAIDAFFPLLEVYGERVEDVETQVIEHPETGQINRIHDLKRNLLTARRAVWPQREMLNALVRDESPFISSQTQVYLRDCYDHTIQLIDMIETDREIASGLIDIHLSSASNHMNQVMKVLTIISTIFIPLTFIVGVYGMNFDRSASRWNMPELGWRYGYPVTLLVMTAIAVGLVWIFWRRGWIGTRDGF
ncbi:MAG: magnesium/cobalt transporter CorA [Rhodobacterales bacterium]|nr:magnesium/cobalt transporter CorA [Rhodobacterales bacterium]